MARTARQIGKASRAKGNRGELELAHILDNWFMQYSINRTPNSGGLWIPGDLNGVDWMHIECKRQETITMGAWIEQASEDCPRGQLPVIMYRKNHMRWRADMDLEDFLSILVVSLDRFDLSPEDIPAETFVEAIAKCQEEFGGGTLCR